MTTTTTTTVSAPGKILLAGGYLVLEAPNPGLVIAVDKRFYTTAQATRSSEMPVQLPIQVHSPQFDKEWSYVYNYETQETRPAETNTSENPFVEKTLRISLAYLLQASISSSQERDDAVTKLVLTIQADNDFYSLVPHLQARGLDRSYTAAQSLPVRLPAAKNADGKIFKTGLGSSACLVTSLVGALYYSVQEKPSATIQTVPTVVANLAQLCHCHAQGKVGSGFDVSAALYGSHVYQRFPKTVLQDILQELETNTTALPVKQITSLVQEKWPGGVVAPISLSNNSDDDGNGSLLQVMLADVSGGSESPSMARTVLAWKKDQSSPIVHWDDLVTTNQETIQLLQDLSKLPVTEETKNQLASSPPDEWPNTSPEAGPVLQKLKQSLDQSRTHLKAMGDAAGVPIEPNVQTKLADATSKVPGVLTALVPGAGGYDALACLYIDTPAVRESVCRLWQDWADAQVCPLTIQGADYGQGLRLEASVPENHCEVKE